MAYTLVAFHAHPDDEALLTAGTMARAAAEGHRVVLVVATDGASGLVGSDVLAAGESLADRRLAELRRSATALGCARVELLGYADSGLDGHRGRRGGVRPAPTSRRRPARLAELLVEEDADALTMYDPAGGYGHPDHVQVHRVGARAARAGRHAGGAGGDGAARPARASGRGGRAGLPVPAGVRPDVVRAGVHPAAPTSPTASTCAATRSASGSRWRRTRARPRPTAATARSPRSAGCRCRCSGEVFGHEWFVERGREPGRCSTTSSPRCASGRP